MAESKPNILLIILDSARAQNMSVYGYHRETTPFLSKYADRATLYEQARSPGIHSIASHASIWTGYHVDEHGAIRHHDRIPSTETVWKKLSDQGYQTGLFTANAIVAHTSNLSEPFDTVVTTEHTDTRQKLFEEAFGPRDIARSEGIIGNLNRCFQNEHTIKSLLNSAYHIYLRDKSDDSNTSINSSDIVSKFDQWQTDAKNPWAACINLLDPHLPYQPSPAHNLWGDNELLELQSSLSEIPSKEFIQSGSWWKLKAFEHLYDGGIREADAHIQQIIESLAASVHDNTLVVVTSDHGEGFGEKSAISNAKMVDHSWGIHEVLTHIPLIVKYPGQSKKHIEPNLASLTNFARTALDTSSNSVSLDSFATDEPVVVSSHRLLSDDIDIFEDSEECVEDYLGPWRAVYDQEDGHTKKYIRRENDSATINVSSIQSGDIIDDTDNGVVRDIFEEIELEFTEDTEDKIDDEISNRLKDLGYIT